MNARHILPPLSPSSCLRRRTVMWTVLALVAVLLLGACAGEQEPYPAIITEMADVRTDHTGRLSEFLTDDGRLYTVTNTDIPLHRPDTLYRAVVGFVPLAGTPSAASSPSDARIYTLTGAQVLADSTAVVRHDPTDIESMWAAGSYINMQLTAKSQGGRHHWGYAVDARQMAGTDGRLHSRHYLSVHHAQAGDPLSYSVTCYCSISVPAIPQYRAGDTVTVTVHTFASPRSWTFCP